MNEEKVVYCGSRLVSKDQKKQIVNDIFSEVHTSYDLMNNIMSLGLHHIWKMEFVSLMARCLIYKKNPKIIDMACGTGDIALKFLKRYSSGKLILCDINLEMIKIAENKIDAASLSGRADYLVVDATKLPFQDKSFDLYGIAFGLRNVTDIDLALQEAYRVLKPFSYFLCMEFSHIETSILSKFYEFYTSKLIPFLGEKIAKSRKSYEYLVESIKTFPTKVDFQARMEMIGFKNVNYFTLNFGNVAIHMGQVH